MSTLVPGSSSAALCSLDQGRPPQSRPCHAVVRLQSDFNHWSRKSATRLQEGERVWEEQGVRVGAHGHQKAKVTITAPLSHCRSRRGRRQAGDVARSPCWGRSCGTPVN